MMLSSNILITLLLFGALYTNGQTLSLEQYVWKNRIIVINNGSSNTLSTDQENLLVKDMSGLNERNLLVFKIDGLKAHELVNGKYFTVDPQELKSLKLENGVFEVVLIGKDGGIKFRETSLVQSSEIYNIIDQMPMRKSEMRRQ